MAVSFSFSAFWHKVRVPLMLAGLLATILLVFFWKNIVITIHSGELGVKYSRLWGGTDLKRPYGEGLHLVWPFDILYIYDTRILEHSEDMVMLTQTGLPVTVNISCKYQLDREGLPLFHQQVGPQYKQKIILPMMQSVARQVFGAYPLDAIYHTARQELEDVMMVGALSSVGRLPITIHTFTIKKISLPLAVEEAIVEKGVAEQRYRRYEFLLLEEGEEAKRKQIEALGIKNFQAVVNSNMTENYLRYEGIRATQALANSPNAKFVIAGGGKDGLPVILNTQDATPVTPASPLPTPVVAPDKSPSVLQTKPVPSESTANAALIEEGSQLETLTKAINDVLHQRITPPPQAPLPSMQGER